jgi:general secretion pathway protein A
MYTAFYGLREKPFALVPDPRYLFLAESHREALAHLLYGIDQAQGFICITGEVGTGKTTICRTLLERLAAETEVAFLFNPSRSGIELLQDICAEFGLESSGLSRSDLSGELNSFLLKKKQEKRRVLLIIDEAQNLSESTLEQVRLLSNLETSSSKLIQILLLGQPELDRKLDSPELRQLRQRISVRWSLHPMIAKETRAYVRHRLHVAAEAERDVFSDSALREIHRRTGGVPRLVNVLCDRVLLAGYVARAPRIGPAIVKQAAREIPDAKRRRPVAQRAAPRQPRATTRRIGVGAIFAAGLVVGLAVSGGLVVGSMDLLDAPLKRLLAGDSASGVADVVTAPDDSMATSTRFLEPEVELAELRPQEKIEATASMVVESAAPLEVKQALTADALEFEATTEPIAEGVATGEFLAAVLDSEDEHLTRRDAVNAILEIFALPTLHAAPPTNEHAIALLATRGLAAHVLEGGDLEVLRSLNHPALLRLQADEDSAPRLVALLALDGDLASIHGVTGHGPLWVPTEELSELWDGAAWVAWRDYESIRPMLEFGEQGHAVLWLQSALREFGYYEGAPTGLFDNDTREGLRAFQVEQGLLPDGVAGPRTRMVLYDLLDRYDVPRLIEDGDEREVLDERDGVEIGDAGGIEIASPASIGLADLEESSQ